MNNHPIIQRYTARDTGIVQHKPRMRPEVMTRYEVPKILGVYALVLPTVRRATITAVLPADGTLVHDGREIAAYSMQF
jgi:hypothetical protein